MPIHMSHTTMQSDLSVSSDSVSVSARKMHLRRAVRERIRSLDAAYCAAADRAIREQLFSLPEYRKATRIFCFVSRPTEADTRDIIRHALSLGKTIAVPRCEGSGIMQAYAITDPETDLIPGMYGIPEPTRACPLVPADTLDLILLPCCSCSHDGKRLGFGGGFYDRYLEHTNAITIVLCREELTCEEIPVDTYDRSMDIVLTEAGVFRT